jgi:hypothetical protein
MEIIIKFIEHGFKDSNLHDDYAKLLNAPER